MSPRTLRIAAAVPATALLLLVASPAAAISRDDGDSPGPGLSVWETVGYFVGIPLLAFLVLTALVFGPSSARGPRYRPGLGWWAEPVWFNGPEASERTGASVVTRVSTEGGGASARW